MSVIIRLQNLPWSANAHDIREFFKGLSIPEGGVHIVGGELGDAFIAFSSDEDARLAMQKSGTSLKGIQITLLLSSRSEMQKVIEAARQQAMGIQPFMAPVAPPAPPIQPITPAQLPSQPGVQPQFQGAGTIQNQAQRAASEVQSLPNNQNIYSGRSPQLNQPPQNFSQPYNANQAPFVPNQMPYSGQKVPNFPPGAVPSPGGMQPHYIYGPTPVVAALPPAPVISQHIPPMENTCVSTNFTAMEQQTYNDPPHAAPKQQSHKEEEKEKDKKIAAPSSASSSSREKREKDNKGRDDRRRRSKSRSRSKDRDRRRRHRSRSRSRDKSGRRKRSRSRERDRTRERDRQRDRRDNRDSSRTHREKSERSSHETSLEPKINVSENAGIPGLGDIPDDIPKEGLSIFTQPSSNNPVRTKESPSNNSGWIKPPNVADTNLHNSPFPCSENPQQKPFLLANPSTMVPFGNTPGAPLLVDSPLMKNSPVRTGPYSSPPVDGSFKEQLLQREDDEGPVQEWTHDDRKFRDDDDFGYRNQNSNKGTDIDHSKRSWGNESWDKVDHEREGPFSQRPFSQRDEHGYNQDNNIADSHSQGRGNHQERRENIYTTRSFAGFQSDFSNDYDDRFGRGGYRGRGRRGGFGRDNDRGPEIARLEYHEEPPFRDIHPQDFDRSRGGRGFFRGRGGRIPLNTEPPRERRSRTCSVEVLNVPTNASYVSIRELFAGIFVPTGSIKIIGGERGERIGVALVQFRSTWDAFEAYKRSGGYILNSRVQVRFIDDHIYEQSRDIMQSHRETGRDIMQSHREIDRDITQNNRETDRDIMQSNRETDRSETMEITSPCVYVSGLPVGCTDHDVAKLFEDFKFADIVLELEKGSRQPSGGCFVRFISPDEAEHALSEIKHPTIDGNPVKVAICSPEAMEEASKERKKIKTKPQPQVQTENYRPSEIGTKEHIMAITQHRKSTENGSNKNISDKKSETKNENEKISTKVGDLLTDSIVIKNVSSDINETSIRDFFSDEGLIPEKVYFNKPDSEGQCDVFVVFPKILDAKHAIKKNSQHLGSTKVFVELISKPSVMLAMGMPFDPRELFLKGNEEHKGPDISEKDDQNDDKDYYIKEGFPPRKMSPSHYENNNMRGGRNYNPRYNRSDEHLQGGYRPRHPFRYRRDQDRQPSERTNFDDRNPEVPIISEPPQDFGRPGCVIALSNVPYVATTEDILNFFKDFDGLQPENVIRRYDELNRPTSDSRISLRSPEEAVKAVETLNNRYMLGRPIFIKLVD